MTLCWLMKQTTVFLYPKLIYKQIRLWDQKFPCFVVNRINLYRHHRLLAYNLYLYHINITFLFTNLLKLLTKTQWHPILHSPTHSERFPGCYWRSHLCYKWDKTSWLCHHCRFRHCIRRLIRTLSVILPLWYENSIILFSE